MHWASSNWLPLSFLLAFICSYSLKLMANWCAYFCFYLFIVYFAYLPFCCSNLTWAMGVCKCLRAVAQVCVHTSVLVHISTCVRRYLLFLRQNIHTGASWTAYQIREFFSLLLPLSSSFFIQSNCHNLVTNQYRLYYCKHKWYMACNVFNMKSMITFCTKRRDT